MKRREFLTTAAAAGASPFLAGGQQAAVPKPAAPFRPASWLRHGLIQAEGWHEPYIFVVRRGGQPLNAHETYEHAQSEAVIRQLSEQGVECYETHFYKGFGIDAERPEMEETKRAAETAHRYGMRVSAYIQWNTMMYETFFAEEPRAKNWIQRDVAGLPILLTYGYQQSFRYRPCFSCQPYLDYLKRVVKLAVEWVKADFIDFDNFDVNAEPDSCHCPWCVSGFRSYLKRKYSPAKRKERFGFEAVDFIGPPQWNLNNPPEKLEIIYDPAIQEWVDYRCQVMADALRQVSTYAKSLNPEVAIEINPRGIDGSNRAWEAGIDHRRILKWTDTFVTEESDKAAYHSDGRLVSKIRSYKLARAFHQILVPVPQDALDLAESLAFNQTIAWVGAYPISDEFLKYIAFYRRYRDFYAGTDDVATVAVFRSFPSITYHNAHCQLSAILAEQALIQARVPFDLIFDEHLAGLARYRAVILPDSECLSDLQLARIRSFVDNGGGLVATGSSGLYDEWRRLRTTPGLRGLVDSQPAVQAYEERVRGQSAPGGPSTRKEYGRGRVVYVPKLEFNGPLPQAEAYFAIHNKFWKRPRNGQQIIDGIHWAARGNVPLKIDGPPYLVANLVSQPAGNRQMLHLVNYSKAATVKSTPVVCHLPEGKSVKRIDLFSPGAGASGSLPFTSSPPAVSFTIPTVKIYTVVAMTW